MHTDFLVFSLSLKINHAGCSFEKHLNLPERWYYYKNMISIHNTPAVPDQNNKYTYKRISAAPEQYDFRRISKNITQIKNRAKHVYKYSPSIL